MSWFLTVFLDLVLCRLCILVYNMVLDRFCVGSSEPLWGFNVLKYTAWFWISSVVILVIILDCFCVKNSRLFAVVFYLVLTLICVGFSKVKWEIQLQRRYKIIKAWEFIQPTKMRAKISVQKRRYNRHFKIHVNKFEEPINWNMSNPTFSQVGTDTVGEG